MNRQIHHWAVIRMAVSWLLIALLSVSQMQGQQPPNPHLSRHARRIHKVLAEYPQGSFLHLFLRDGTEGFGSLGSLSDSTFLFTYTNKAASSAIGYDEVDHATSGMPSPERLANAAQSHRRHQEVLFLITFGTLFGVLATVLAKARN